jgi:polyisoprenoid-binding protein YceI
MSKILRLVISVLFSISNLALAATYKLDPAHSDVGFSVKHMVISNVKGRFNKVEGSFDFDEKTSEVSKIDVKVDAASINTNDAKRDEHLMSPDFFDVKKFPDIRFTADKVKVKKDSSVKVNGQLTIKGVTKPVTMDLTYGGSVIDPNGNEKVGFSLSGKIDRKNWGITWNKNLDKGGVAVSNEVAIAIEGEANKAK